MSQANQGCTETPVLDIPAALILLNENLSSLEGRVRGLHERLAPLLIAQDCEEKKTSGAICQAMSQVGDAIDSYASRVFRLESQVELILSELQI